MLSVELLSVPHKQKSMTPGGVSYGKGHCRPSRGVTKEGPGKGKYPAREAAAAVWRKTALLVSAVQAAWQFQPVFFSTISAASSYLLGLSVCMESLRA